MDHIRTKKLGFHHLKLCHNQRQLKCSVQFKKIRKIEGSKLEI